MNTSQLAKQIGAHFRIRPMAFRVGANNERLPQIDDEWRLAAVLRSPARLQLVNVVTGHVLDLESDNVQERRSPDFLMLRCQVTLRADGLEIEPIHRGAPIRPEPVRLAEIIAAIKSAPLFSRSSVAATYQGVLVLSTGVLGSVTRVSAERVRVGVIEDADDDVFLELPIADYPRLTATHGRDRVEVMGKIARRFAGIWLDDAELRFIE